MIQGVGSASASTAARAPTARGGGGEVSDDQRKTQRAAQQTKQSLDQQRQIAALQSRDREVRAHEAAHKAVGGSLAGSMSFSYETGPDGRQYAVGGEVSIDTGAERDPQATIAKMRQVISAALAPAQPSSQDQAVAAAARATMAEAQRQLNQPDQDGTERTRPVDNDQQSGRVAGYQTAPAPGGLISLIA